METSYQKMGLPVNHDSSKWRHLLFFNRCLHFDMPRVATNTVRRSCSPYMTAHSFSHFAQRIIALAISRSSSFRALPLNIGQLNLISSADFFFCPSFNAKYAKISDTKIAKSFLIFLCALCGKNTEAESSNRAPRSRFVRVIQFG